MVALNENFAPQNPALGSKNRVGNFFVRAGDRAGADRPATRNRIGEKRPVVTIIASGRPNWPSRDPIGERGGLNLYVANLNNVVNFWDYLGFSAGCCGDGTSIDCSQWSSSLSSLSSAIIAIRASTSQLVNQLNQVLWMRFWRGTAFQLSAVAGLGGVVTAVAAESAIFGSIAIGSNASMLNVFAALDTVASTVVHSNTLEDAQHAAQEALDHAWDVHDNMMDMYRDALDRFRGCGC